MSSSTKNLLQHLNNSFYHPLQNPQETPYNHIKSRIKTNIKRPMKKSPSTMRKSPSIMRRSPSNIKLTHQRVKAKSRYQDLTNMTKFQQKSMIWDTIQSNKINKKDWSYAYYTGNNKKSHVSKTFTNFQNKQLNQFPDNNTKYNIQFLDRSLHGTNLKFPRSQSGEFKKPSNSLYSKHYRPIVKQKVKLNQDWELRPSKYGKINLDFKRDRIMDEYQLQANPFRTPNSNSLISKITKSQIY